ncbi:MAG TPA: phosphopantothenoylcysteine decarboxylase, partial [Thermoleophilaceae bacterium]|nr:phosphopantothenoylcysteine decarboxylase [Thermoleophilaceae bacterium]
LELEPTTDVLAALAAERRPGQTIVGFAAEHGEGAAERAREKLERKGLDAIVLNDVSRPGIGFDSEENEVSIVTREGSREVPKALKAVVAATIIEVVEKLHAEEAKAG